MRVVLYSHTAFFEPILSLTRALGRDVELHLLLEVAPEAWQAAAFDTARDGTSAGLVPADAVLASAFPPSLREYWEQTASFHLVVHSRRKSLHPASLGLGARVVRFIKSLRPDIIHVDDVDVSLRFPVVMPLLGPYPIVLSVHDPTPHLGEANWRKRLARRIVYPRARHFIVHGQRQAQQLAMRSSISSNRISSVPFGSFDLLRLWSDEMPQPEASPVILFFGRLSAYKGLEVLYEASRIATRRIPGLRLIVAGKAVGGYELPPPPPDIDVEVRERYIQNAELAELFRRATFVVCPYLDASQSGVVMTSYAFHTPVIATDVGGLSEDVINGETGLVVPPGDPAALAESIVELIQQPLLMDHMRETIARLRTTHFDWRASADRTLRVYQHVLHSAATSH